MKNKIVVVAGVTVGLLILIFIVFLAVKVQDKNIDISNSRIEEFEVSNSTVAVVEESTKEETIIAGEIDNETIVGVVDNYVDGGDIDGFDLNLIQPTGSFNIVKINNATEMCKELYKVFGSNLYQILNDANKFASDTSDTMPGMVLMDTLKLVKSEYGWQLRCDLVDGSNVFLVNINSDSSINEGSILVGDEETFGKYEGWLQQQNETVEEPSSGWTADGERMWWYDENGEYHEAQGE